MCGLWAGRPCQAAIDVIVCNIAITQLDCDQQTLHGRYSRRTQVVCLWMTIRAELPPMGGRLRSANAVCAVSRAQPARFPLFPPPRSEWLLQRNNKHIVGTCTGAIKESVPHQGGRRKGGRSMTAQNEVTSPPALRVASQKPAAAPYSGAFTHRRAGRPQPWRPVYFSPRPWRCH